jgi:hypothetical protein
LRIEHSAIGGLLKGCGSSDGVVVIFLSLLVGVLEICPEKPILSPRHGAGRKAEGQSGDTARRLRRRQKVFRKVHMTLLTWIWKDSKAASRTPDITASERLLFVRKSDMVRIL